PAGAAAAGGGEMVAPLAVSSPTSCFTSSGVIVGGSWITIAGASAAARATPGASRTSVSRVASPAPVIRPSIGGSPGAPSSRRRYHNALQAGEQGDATDPQS